VTILAKKGVFITIEGSEGVGKSTAVKFIEQILSSIGRVDFVCTREPGGTVVAEKIRQILLAKDQEPIDHVTELLLMFAGRRQHLQQVILPALVAGKWVICDRFTDASYAYQGGGRGIADESIARLETLVHPDLSPVATILLDAPVSVGLTRIIQRGAKDRFEQEREAFFERVRQKYLQRAEKAPDRYYRINAAQSLEHVQAELRAVLQTLIDRYVD
jgi:dTMP kinase